MTFSVFESAVGLLAESCENERTFACEDSVVGDAGVLKMEGEGRGKGREGKGVWALCVLDKDGGLYCASSAEEVMIDSQTPNTWKPLST